MLYRVIISERAWVEADSVEEAEEQVFQEAFLKREGQRIQSITPVCDEEESRDARTP